MLDDDKLVRCHGQIKRSNLPDEKKFPVLLPDDYDFTKLDDTFTRVGVDYAGPLSVKNIYSSNKTMYKSYIVIYACASSSTVHLDLSVDATSETFIRSFLRFISRRGMPGTMVSDNGKTFESKELKEFCASKGIKWKHIVERSPWWGGFYERLVRSVKRCLKKVLRTARLSYEELLTLLLKYRVKFIK